LQGKDVRGKSRSPPEKHSERIPLRETALNHIKINYEGWWGEVEREGKQEALGKDAINEGPRSPREKKQEGRRLTRRQLVVGTGNERSAVCPQRTSAGGWEEN